MVRPAKGKLLCFAVSVFFQAVRTPFPLSICFVQIWDRYCSVLVFMEIRTSLFLFASHALPPPTIYKIG